MCVCFYSYTKNSSKRASTCSETYDIFGRQIQGCFIRIIFRNFHTFFCTVKPSGNCTSKCEQFTTRKIFYCSVPNSKIEKKVDDSWKKRDICRIFFFCFSLFNPYAGRVVCDRVMDETRQLYVFSAGQKSRQRCSRRRQRRHSTTRERWTRSTRHTYRT